MLDDLVLVDFDDEDVWDVHPFDPDTDPLDAARPLLPTRRSCEAVTRSQGFAVSRLVPAFERLDSGGAAAFASHLVTEPVCTSEWPASREGGQLEEFCSVVCRSLEP